MQSINGNQQQAQPQPQISKSSKAAIIAELQAAIAVLQTQDANISHLVECRQKITFAEELAGVYLRDPSTFNLMQNTFRQGSYPAYYNQGILSNYPGMGSFFGDGNMGMMNPHLMHAQQMNQFGGYNPMGGNMQPQRDSGPTAPTQPQRPLADNRGARVLSQEQNDATNSSSGHLPFELSAHFRNIWLRPEIVNNLLVFAILDQTQPQQHIGYINAVDREVQINSIIHPETNAKLENIVQTFILDYIIGPKEFPISSELMQNLWGRIKAVKSQDLNLWTFRSANADLNRDAKLMHKAPPAQPE